MNTEKSLVSLIYIFTVFAWGSAWVAIDIQLNYVSSQVSLFLRFAAAIFMVIFYLLFRPRQRKLSGLDHVSVFMLGITNFSLNYLLVYEAVHYLGGSLSSVIFTTMVIWNVINARVFYKFKITSNAFFGCLFGVGGVAIALQAPLASDITSTNLVKGSLLVVGAAYIGSIGNMIALRNSKTGIPVFTANTYGMCWGVLIITAVIVLGSDFELVIPINFIFIASILYLSLICTVLGFFSYYFLVDKLAPVLFSYIIALFPVISLGLDVILFNKVLTAQMVGGVLAILFGLFLLAPIKPIRNYSASLIL